MNIRLHATRGQLIEERTNLLLELFFRLFQKENRTGEVLAVGPGKWLTVNSYRLTSKSARVLLKIRSDEFKLTNKSPRHRVSDIIAILNHRFFLVQIPQSLISLFSSMANKFFSRRRAVQIGPAMLAYNTVKVTLGPKGRNTLRPLFGVRLLQR